MSEPPAALEDNDDPSGEEPGGQLPPAKPRNVDRKLKNFKLRDDPRIVGAYSLEDVEQVFGAAFEIGSQRRVRAAKASGNYVDLSDPNNPKTWASAARHSKLSRPAGTKSDESEARIRRVVDEAERRIVAIVEEFERRLLSIPSDHLQGQTPDHLAARSRSLGAVPGRKMASTEAQAVLSRIAEGAQDVFSSPEDALSYLEAADIDGYGGTALSLIEAGRATSVLARLDVIRFGSQG